MGRDVGRDEGREQSEWRDLVARLELQAPIDPADAPWPDRENLRAKTRPGTSAGTGTVAGDTAASAAEDTAAEPTREGDRPDGAGPQDAGPQDANRGDDPDGDDPDGDASHGDGHGRRGPADRSRVIRPAGFAQFCEAAAEPAAQTDADVTSAWLPGSTDEPAGPAGEAGPAGSTTPVDSADTGLNGPTLGGPRDYGLDEPRDDDLDELWDDRYIPPPVPPQPTLDPVAKGAWLALFGGPGYLLVATVLSWQIAGWAALASVIAFVTGFVVLVFRLGDGPSKRDGPDQGAVV